MTRVVRAAAIALALALPAALPAMSWADQTDKATFDLSIKGIRAGVLAFSGVTNGKTYAVSGRLESTGLAGLLRKIRYDAASRGTISADGTRFTPSQYQEKADTGKRQSESVMDYKAGVPQVKVYNPPRDPRPGDVDPATQGGTVDPLTALYAVLRDVPADQACTTKVRLFDGRHASSLTLSPGKTEGETITCNGEYRRIAGFSDKEMAEKTRFPFRLTYAPAGDGTVRVISVDMDSIYGTARLKRR